MIADNKTHRFSHSSGGLKQLFLMSDILIFLVLWTAALVLGPRTWLWMMGLVISIGGFVLWMIARRQLGASFMIGAAAKQLVTTGLYRRFRHPIYLFGGLSTFGALLALQVWWLMLLWFAYAAPIQWVRLRREDRVLEAEFGDAFVELRKYTWL